MAAIVVPPEFNQTSPFKMESVVQTAEVQPDSEEHEDQSEAGDGEVGIMAVNRKKRPGKPKTGGPGNVVKIPVQPIPPTQPSHPIFVPDGTTLDNVAAHMVCNDWFLKNVRNLVEEYKAMQIDTMRQARQIADLDREVADLKNRLRNVTEERDEYKTDYEAEVLQHQKTQDTLRVVRIELADLRRRYNDTLADLKRHKAALGEALRENGRLKVDLADKEARIRDLEEKLRISNASEDAANERVTELQRCIYELERSKTQIEKQKDRAEQASRVAADNVKRLNDRIIDLNREIRRLQRGRRVGINGVEALEASPSEARLEMQATEPSLRAPAAPSANDDPLFEALSVESEEVPSPANEE